MDKGRLIIPNLSKQCYYSPMAALEMYHCDNKCNVLRKATFPGPNRPCLARSTIVGWTDDKRIKICLDIWQGIIIYPIMPPPKETKKRFLKQSLMTALSLFSYACNIIILIIFFSISVRKVRMLLIHWL